MRFHAGAEYRSGLDRLGLFCGTQGVDDVALFVLVSSAGCGEKNPPIVEPFLRFDFAGDLDHLLDVAQLHGGFLGRLG